MEEKRKQFTLGLFDLFSKIECLERVYAKLILARTESAVDNLISEAVTILGEKGEDFGQNLQALFTGEHLFSGLADEINADVDGMVDRMGKQLADGGQVDVEENREMRVKRLALSGHQRNLEVICSADEGIRGLLEELLSELACHDLIRQIIENIDGVFILMFKVIKDKAIPANGLQQEIDIRDTLSDMYNCFTSSRERTNFMRDIQRGFDFKLKPKARAIPVDLMIKTNIQDFLDLFINYYKKMLIASNKIVEASVKSLLTRCLQLLELEPRTANFTDESLKSMQMFKAFIIKRKSDKKIEVDEIQAIVKNLTAASSGESYIAQKLQAIMTDLQFQDQIKELSHSLLAILRLFQETLFYQKEADIDSVFDSAQQPNFLPFAEKLLAIFTSKDERRIIKRTFHVD